MKKVYSILIDEELIKAIRDHCKPIGLKQGAFCQEILGQALGWQKKE